MELVKRGMPIAIIFFVAFIAAASVQIGSITDDDRVSYIVGGTEATPHEFPWMVSIQYMSTIAGKQVYSHHCGGSIISAQWVLSAAHCFIGTETNNEVSFFKVISGAHNLLKSGSRSRKFGVAVIITHSGFNETGLLENDIALLKIVGKFTLDNRTTVPIRLPTSFDHNTFDCHVCVTMGWGIADQSRLSNVLQKVILPIEKTAFCTMVTSSKLTERAICTDTLYLGQQSCPGDSGGPLVCVNNGVYTLAGVTGYGSSNCSSTGLIHFTRISSFRDWIDQFTALDLENSIQ